MTDKKRDLSSQNIYKIENADRMSIGILVSEWNEEITFAMLDATKSSLLASGVKIENVRTVFVPGSFELPTAAVMLLEADENLDAVICLGCIIQGETRHFEFIAQAVATGIMKVGVDYNTPVIFGVLTCNNMQQALDRAGGKYGNKGTEAAISCLKMLQMERKLRNK